MKIELNKTQAEALLHLIDIAVKSGGLSVASTAVFFHGMLETAARADVAAVDSVNPSGLQHDGTGPG